MIRALKRDHITMITNCLLVGFVVVMVLSQVMTSFGVYVIHNRKAVLYVSSVQATLDENDDLCGDRGTLLAFIGGNVSLDDVHRIAGGFHVHLGSWTSRPVLVVASKEPDTGESTQNDKFHHDRVCRGRRKSFWNLVDVWQSCLVQYRFVCLKNKDCGSNPCQNGATYGINPITGHYWCRCAEGYVGGNCELMGGTAKNSKTPVRCEWTLEELESLCTSEKCDSMIYWHILGMLIWGLLIMIGMVSVLPPPGHHISEAQQLLARILQHLPSPQAQAHPNLPPQPPQAQQPPQPGPVLAP